MLAKLTTLRQTNVPNSDEFSMPLVPLLPCLGIIGNNALIGAFDGQTFINYLIFTLIGVAIYTVYGLNNSVLEKESGGVYEGCSEVAEAEDIQMHDYNSFKDQKAPFMNN
jgi:hypothetical protein